MNKTKKPLKPLEWLLLTIIFMILAIYSGNHHNWILYTIFEIPTMSCGFMFGKTLMDKILH